MKTITQLLKFTSLSIICSLTFHLQASDNVPAPKQTTPLLFKGATVHTVSGTDVHNAYMLVENGRISAIGTELNSIKIPSYAKIIDVTGKHIYPGFIAANSVIGLSEIQSIRATLDYAETGAINPNARAIVAINPDSELIPTARLNGVLTALSVPNAEPVGIINGTSALVQLDGWTWEEMAIEAELGLHINVPVMRLNPDLFAAPYDTRMDEMRKANAQRILMLEEAFDAAIAYRDARAQGKVNVDVRMEAMLPVLPSAKNQRKVFFHAMEIGQIRYAVQFAKRYGLKAVIVGGLDAPHVADLLKQNQIPVMVTHIHKLPNRRGANYDVNYDLASRLAEQGVKFCIARSGSDDDAPNERNLPYEAAVASAFGLDKNEALKAITLYPAQILGVSDKLGSLEEGKLATFFVSNGDPLETLNKIEQVYIQGRLVEMTSRQVRLKDKYQQRLEQQRH